MMRLPRVSRDVARCLGLGLILREAFSAWTGHPFDFEIWIRNAYWVAHGSSPYTLLPPVPGASFTYTSGSITSVAYLPLWSLILAGLYQVYALVGGGNRFVLYFFLKQPPILGDVLLGALLYLAALRWGAARPTAKRLLATWMVFPYPILISAIWGQFDSLVAALVLASLLAATAWKRSSLLGLGVLLKSLPIIFVPFALFRERGRSRAWALLALAIPAAFTAAVFAITGWGLGGFTGMLAWEAHVAPQGLTPATLLLYPPIGSVLPANRVWLYAFGYLWIPAAVVGAWWVARRFRSDGPHDTLQAFLVLTVILFLTRWQVNEQYLMYLLPLLMLDVALWHPERRSLFHATWILGLAFLLLNNFFLVRFAMPLFPDALNFEFGLQADVAFSGFRTIVLILLGFLFSAHLVQLGLVVANPIRSATPWTVLVLRRVWSASTGWVRSVAAGRGG